MTFRGFAYNYCRYFENKKKYLYSSRFQPSSTYKFSKFHKIIYSKMYSRNSVDYALSSFSEISTGIFIQLLSIHPKFGYWADFQFKTFRNLLKKPYKKNFRINAYPYLGITKKPAEVRMGKGKGSKISHRVFPVYSGFLMGTSFRRNNSIVSDFRFVNKFKIYTAKFSGKIFSNIGSFLFFF